MSQVWEEFGEGDTLEELMAEPPGGFNHGRKRNDHGGWTPLETDDAEPSIKRPVQMMKHGTIYAYRVQKCRCEFCRLIHAQRQRRWRSMQSKVDPDSA